MIIGLTGRYAAGKGAVSDYLKTRGFVYSSLSDAIRSEILARGQEITRERLLQVGNELRETYGPAILARRVVQQLDPSQKAIVDSIRNPFEVEALRELPSFTLLFVDAPEDVRFQRLRERNRERDPVTFEDFRRIEGSELKGDPAHQQLLKVEALADRVIVNDSTLEALASKIDSLLCELRGNY